MYELYLVHSGILGMKWGVRRFQNEDGTLTEAGKTRYGSKGTAPRHKPSNARKIAKQRAANLEKARQAKAAKAAHEAEKKNALERGSAEEVMKFKTELSNKELQDVVNRLKLESQLSDFLPKEEVRAKSKSLVDKVIDVADKTRSNVEKGINVWNTIVKIHNSFSENKWQPIGGENVKQAAENKRKAEEKERKAAQEAAENKRKAEAREKLVDKRTRMLVDKLLKNEITYPQYNTYYHTMETYTDSEFKKLLEVNPAAAALAEAKKKK